MPIENLDLSLLPLAGTIVVVLALGFGVEPLLRLFTGEKKDDDSEKQWATIPSAGRAIGALESILYSLAIVVGYPVFIGVWLAFKVAAKWDTWAHIVQLPELQVLILSRRRLRTEQNLEHGYILDLYLGHS